MIHVAAPHFLWLFAVQYAVHQINLQLRVSLPETTPTLRWTGKVGDASAFRFYHPTSRRVLSSQDVTFDESVSYYHPAEPVEVAVDSGAARGAEPAGVGTGGAETGGAEPGGSPGVPLRREPLSPQRIREWYARHCHHATGAAGAGAGGGAAGARAAGGASAGAAGGVAGAGGARAAGPGGACTGGTGGTGAAGAGGAVGVGAAGTGAGGAAGVVSRDPGAEVTGAVFAFSRGTARPRPYYVPLLQQVLVLQPSPGPPPLLSPPPVQSQSQLQPASPLPGPSPYSGPTRGLTERCEPESRPVSPDSRPASLESCFELLVHTVRAGRRVSRPRPPPVPSTHSMTLRPSTAPQHVPLPSPPASSLPDGPDPKSHSLRAASPTVTRFLATAVTDPLFELVAKLVDFATASRLDYATSLVAKSASESVCPPSVGGECALGTDVLEDRQEEFECFATAVPHLVSMLLAPEGDPDAPDILTPRSYAEAIEGPYSSQWQAAMDAEMASWKSTGTYVDEVPPPGASIVSGMWIFRGVDFFQIFSPTPKMTTLRVLLHVAPHRDYELHSLDFSTAFLQGSMHEEIWLRRPPGFTGPFPAGTQWSLQRPVYGLRQAPREWHDTLRTTLAALGFAPSIADPSMFLRSDTTLPPFYVLVYIDDLVFATANTEALAHVKSELQKRHTCIDLGELTSYLGLRITRDRAQRTITLTRSHMVEQVLQRFGFTYSSPLSTPLPTGHSLSALPSDESVEPSGPYPEVVGCLITSGMGLVLGGRARVVLTGHADASWVDELATQRSSQGYTFSLGVTLAHLPADRLGRGASFSSSSQRGHLRLAYMASQANTADVFTKAIQPSCFAFLDWSCDLLFSPTLPMGKWADVCPVFANTILYDVNADTTLPELDPDMPTDPERWWDISTMTIKEALARWMGKAVKAEMEEEMHSLFNNVAWELVPRPLGGNVMKNQWVLTTKYNTDNTVAHEKARLVVKGFTLYGLKQSQLLWYSALNRVLIGGRWSKSQVGESLYFKFAADGVGCWLLVYADDLLAASSSLEMLKDLRELLQNAFELQEITPVQKYLGLEIVWDTSARKLWLHQSAYVDKLRRCFVDKGQKDRCPKTPISVDAYTELTFDDEEYQVREEEEYRQKVGSLQFAVTTTSPAIAYACSKLGSGLTIRSDQHRRELDRCIDYMLNTRDFALEFGGGPNTLRLVGYADSDDAGDWQTRSSTSGYVFMLGGAAVSWASHRIKCMMISSTESEYIAATEVDKEARRLCFLLAEFQLLDAGVPTVIHVDNSSAIAIAEGLGLKGSLKHMERRYIWLQQMVKRKKLALM
ncbi:unnamed protein product [Closterium sp. NIES-53]